MSFKMLYIKSSSLLFISKKNDNCFMLFVLLHFSLTNYTSCSTKTIFEINNDFTQYRNDVPLNTRDLNFKSLIGSLLIGVQNRRNVRHFDYLFLKVWGVAYNHDGSRVVSASEDKSLHVYNIPI